MEPVLTWEPCSAHSVQEVQTEHWEPLLGDAFSPGKFPQHIGVAVTD